MDYTDQKKSLLSRSEEDLLEARASVRSTPRRTLLALILLLLTTFAWFASTISLEHKHQRPFDVPIPPPQEICEHATARPSWHDLPLHRHREFVNAVQRLSTLPSRLGLNTSLYDDFTYVHTKVVWEVHHAAISLPFHRYFIHVFEQALRSDAGYDGPLPFWDWTRDAESPRESVIWDGIAGFGGDGSMTNDHCVQNGPFSRMGKTANYSESGYEPHCVRRHFSDTLEDGGLHSKQWSAEVVGRLLSESSTYEQLREGLENGPHRHLHWGIGGEMPTSSSTNDPLFFLHHAQLDRLWWLWQQKAPDTRDFDFTGATQSKDGQLSMDGAQLTDMIQVLGLAKDVSVEDVMQTKTALLCYKYKIDDQ